MSSTLQRIRSETSIMKHCKIGTCTAKLVLAFLAAVENRYPGRASPLATVPRERLKKRLVTPRRAECMNGTMWIELRST